MMRFGRPCSRYFAVSGLGGRSERPQSWTTDDWPVHDAALVDPNFTMRREELYGDNGR